MKMDSIGPLWNTFPEFLAVNKELNPMSIKLWDLFCIRSCMYSSADQSSIYYGLFLEKMFREGPEDPVRGYRI